jgi:NADH:ubiquinone oxidoreductase subunit F (NADH-binding)
MGFLLPDQPLFTLDEWLATDVGGLGLLRAQQYGPDATIEEIEAGGLRGRGGAGFPTGQKWSTIRSSAGWRPAVVCNAAEGEPGTAKDRALMRSNPYQLIEGLMIAAFAIGAQEAYLALKSTFVDEIDAVLRATTEMQQAGMCQDCSIAIVRGPSDYLYGEESAMLEVIEGKDALPRVLPPYLHGLFATTPQEGWEAGPGAVSIGDPNPTLVNNVETLSNVPHILARGATWFRGFGTPDSPGTIVTTVSGDVRQPGVAEIELGTPLRTVIDEVGGGVESGRRVKAVLSGVSNAVITGDELRTPLSYEAFTSVGSGLGAAGFLVFDDTACIVEVARQCSAFLAAESCGQCPPCKQGSIEITRLLGQIESGVASDLELGQLQARLTSVTDSNRCYLGTEEQRLVSSVLEKYADELVLHLDLRRCPRPRPLVLPMRAEVPPTVRVPATGHTPAA